MPFLVQLLLPKDKHGTADASRQLKLVRDELTAKFGGVTAYSHVPAEGLWESHDGDIQKDDIVLFEVMADSLYQHWWSEYRRILESRFDQSEIVIRAHEIIRL